MPRVSNDSIRMNTNMRMKMEDRKMQDSMKDVFEILKIKINFICGI